VLQICLTSLSGQTFKIPPGSSLRFVREAPIVLVGKVAGVRTVGRPRLAEQDTRILIQLTRISLNVENVVRGQLQGNDLEFYAYTYSDQNTTDFGPGRFIPTTGTRRMFFLTQFSRGYRSVGDVIDYTLQVASGRHGQDFCQGDSFEDCIAKLLLVPGTGFDSEAFAIGLRKASSTAQQIGSEDLALRLLDQLSHGPDQKIAAAAQRVLRGELSR
jgi:hypothetical protein